MFLFCAWGNGGVELFPGGAKRTYKLFYQNHLNYLPASSIWVGKVFRRTVSTYYSFNLKSNSTDIKIISDTKQQPFQIIL